jgi:hypothetical protein
VRATDLFPLPLRLTAARAPAALPGNSADRAGVEQTDKRMKPTQRLDTIPHEEALRGTALIGTPDDAAERIDCLRDDPGLDEILLEINCGARSAMSRRRKHSACSVRRSRRACDEDRRHAGTCGLSCGGRWIVCFLALTP